MTKAVNWTKCLSQLIIPQGYNQHQHGQLDRSSHTRKLEQSLRAHISNSKRVKNRLEIQHGFSILKVGLRLQPPPARQLFPSIPKLTFNWVQNIQVHKNIRNILLKSLEILSPFSGTITIEYPPRLITCLFIYHSFLAK